MMDEMEVNGETEMNGALDDGVRPPRNNSKPESRQTMQALELEMDEEEEWNSLVHETGDYSGIVSSLTLRKNAAGAARHVSANGGATGATRVLGILRDAASTSGYVLRNAVLLCILGVLVFLFIDSMDETVEQIEETMEKNPLGVHQSSFGGVQNVAQPGGAHAYEKYGDTIHNTYIPVSNVGHAVPSLSQENVKNQNGHYWHDPYLDPFSSYLYERPVDDMLKAQDAFEQKMTSIKQTYGAWNLTDDYHEYFQKYRPSIPFNQFDYRDAPREEFPPDAWQGEITYLNNFLTEAKALVSRVKEGIYAEYGYPTISADGKTKLAGQALKDRDELFRVILNDFKVDNSNGKAVKAGNLNEVLKGVAYLNQNAWDALVLKLLHAMMTGDEFYVVMVGDGVASGSGNNFLQSSVMVFHYLMEPIFNILNVQLISRNMATSVESSATIGAMGGADIFGEADIMIWNSVAQLEEERRDGKDNTLKYKGQYDLFNKQQIMSGEHVPILLTPVPGDIVHDSDGQAWVGNLQPGSLMCDEMTDKEGKDMPSACRHVRCAPENKSFCQEFNSVCWEHRFDYSPSVDQNEKVENSDGDLSTNQHHLEGRKLSMLVLHALDAALDKWRGGIVEGGAPLAEQYWHVGEKYKQIEESIRMYGSRDDQKLSACEQLFQAYPIICHVAMHAATEWTPRVNPYKTSLRSLLRPDVVLNETWPNNAYTAPDVLPYQWKLQDDEIDVHAIAIATYAPAPKTNDYGNFYEDDYFDYEEDEPGSGDENGEGARNLLSEGSKKHPASSDRVVSESNKAHDLKSATRITKKTAITAGDGWMLYNPIAGFCDGSSQSFCNRDASNKCLLEGHNEGRAGILGDALSGWLILRLPNIKEGIILARFDTSAAPDRRRTSIPSDDFELDIAINNDIRTMSRKEFLDYEKGKVANNLPLWPLLFNQDRFKEESSDDEGETIEVAIRIRSSKGRAASILLTHIYYA